MFAGVRVGFKDGTPRDTLWKVKKWTDLICTPAQTRGPSPPGITVPDASVLVKDLESNNGSFPIDPHKIRVTVECPPWKRDHVKAVARFCGTWRTQTASQVDVEIRGEIGPPRSQIWTKAVPGRPPICIATFTTTTGLWTLHEDSWRSLVSAVPQLTTPMLTIQTEVNSRQ